MGAWAGERTPTLKASDSAEAAMQVRKFVRPGDVMLVKGSRGIRMELIINHLAKEAD
jgi:UDP-N-acetylmuramyl pentapeptide synthase